MYGVVDGVKILGLCALCDLNLTGSRAALGFHTKLKVLLGAVSDYLAEKLSELCGMLGAAVL